MLVVLGLVLLIAAPVAEAPGIAHPQTTGAREPNPDGGHRRGLKPFKRRSEPQ
ncbi:MULTISPECIES: hypothetical protein [unclassified Streptomyces]|uniref:hypothetical protein n=1 Tax=unclassified Streptomyces TaxID=2593676 RepID=UPI003664B380